MNPVPLDRHTPLINNERSSVAMTRSDDWKLKPADLTVHQRDCLLTRQAELALLARESLTIREFSCLMLGLDPTRLRYHEDLYQRYVAHLERLLKEEAIFDDVPF